MMIAANIELSENALSTTNNTSEPTVTSAQDILSNLSDSKFQICNKIPQI